MPYFEYDTTFYAQVPYELEGWLNCTGLRNIPDLEEKVEAYFMELGNMIIKKDFNSFKKSHASKTAEVNFSIYLSYDETLKQLNEVCEDFKQVEKMASFEGYKLIFMLMGALHHWKARIQRKRVFICSQRILSGRCSIY
ncbi:Uncharacterised protein [Porphyromonas macacae]|uniref:Uncharacterized protein n=1 Tax=Porphyromonas macacae TaxID=28115 RepID=A0A379E6H0_9PORP|nr:Uncharacterised protein [Porphyromonas macacae]